MPSTHLSNGKMPKTIKIDKDGKKEHEIAAVLSMKPHRYKWRKARQRNVEKRFLKWQDAV